VKARNTEHIAVLLVGMLLAGVAGSQETNTSPAPSRGLRSSKQAPPMRPAVKTYIDELSSFEPVSVTHTTDAIGGPATLRKPAPPVSFAAGRFKVFFEKGEQRRVAIIQTEERVGHYVEVVPGMSRIEGGVELLAGPKSENGAGFKLTETEQDYFIRSIFRRFSRPLTDEDAALLNKIKDCSMAIFFSGRKGIDKYYEDNLKAIGFDR
jgi:hypothetical protein